MELERDEQTLVIACATDDRYAPHCATMLQSMLAHNEPARVRIFVLHDADLTGACQALLRQVVDAAGAAIRFLPVAPELVSAFPTEKFHRSCWYRVMLPELLPHEHRLIYLDSDMIVLDALDELWQLDLAGAWFAAVVNPLYPFMPDRAARLGLASRSKYLNSGLLVMDLAAWRREGLGERLRRYAGAHPDNPWPEQDALSVVAAGHWLPLDPRWNAQSTVFDLDDRELPFDEAQLEAARKRPAVVHFIGPHKPWSFLCRHPLRHEYHRFRAQIPWPASPPEDRSIVNAVLRFVSLENQLRFRRIARRVGVGL